MGVADLRPDPAANGASAPLYAAIIDDLLGRAWRGHVGSCPTALPPAVNGSYLPCRQVMAEMYDGGLAAGRLQRTDRHRYSRICFRQALYPGSVRRGKRRGSAYTVRLRRQARRWAIPCNGNRPATTTSLLPPPKQSNHALSRCGVVRRRHLRQNRSQPRLFWPPHLGRPSVSVP